MARVSKFLLDRFYIVSRRRRYPRARARARITSFWGAAPTGRLRALAHSCRLAFGIAATACDACVYFRQNTRQLQSHFWFYTSARAHTK